MLNCIYLRLLSNPICLRLGEQLSGQGRNTQKGSVTSPRCVYAFLCIRSLSLMYVTSSHLIAQFRASGTGSVKGLYPTPKVRESQSGGSNIGYWSFRTPSNFSSQNCAVASQSLLGAHPPLEVPACLLCKFPCWFHEQQLLIVREVVLVMTFSRLVCLLLLSNRP